ncbi:hypothetical protein SH2C18_24630 [Clostridium sediminicola]|uniref:AbrB family transcriptional regulator n=1 Tax=Clostridium sediminicola TaxID=3114879 RepID=UPI0031F208E2
MVNIAITLLVGGIGGFLGIKLKIPAGALIGSMLLVAIYNIYSGEGTIPKNFKLVAQIVVGAMIGLNFTIDSFREFKNIIIPTMILVVCLMIFCVVLGFFISKFTGLDLITSLFSCSPGGLTDMTLISEAYGADTSKVVAMHSARLITVIAVLPIIIKIITGYINGK